MSKGYSIAFARTAPVAPAIALCQGARRTGFDCPAMRQNLELDLLCLLGHQTWLLLNISPDEEIRAERRSRASAINSTLVLGEKKTGKFCTKMKVKNERMPEEISLKTSKAKRGLGRPCN
jgi:hypothetical protein